MCSAMRIGTGRWRSGPGWGATEPRTSGQWWRAGPGPVVVDGDGLTALGESVADVTGGRSGPAVLTPHEGEFARLAGEPVGADRLAVVRSLAAATGAVVLLKGPTTVVAAPDGAVLVTTTGDARLATAGTGDVLTGVIAALLAGGLEPLRAAAGRRLSPRPGWSRRLAARLGRQ